MYQIPSFRQDESRRLTERSLDQNPFPSRRVATFLESKWEPHISRG
jgi:hypothetical protein